MSRVLFTTAAMAAVAFVVLTARTAAVPPDEKPQPKAEVPKNPAEPNKLILPTRKEAMALKLKSSQELLEGIALNDFAKIQKAANNVIVVSNVSEFLNAYKGAEYQYYVKIFRQPAETIGRKAKDRNMDGVMVGYNDLTLSCLKCHEAMRDNKFEIRLDGLKREPNGGE
jgi:hypothetical protein